MPLWKPVPARRWSARGCDYCSEGKLRRGTAQSVHRVRDGARGRPRTFFFQILSCGTRLVHVRCGFSRRCRFSRVDVRCRRLPCPLGS
eukprot:gene17325-biopygen20368